MSSRFFKRFLEVLSEAEQWMGLIGFTMMVVVLGIDILGRELPSLFGGGKLWATPIAVYGNVFISFIGMGIASSTAAHLRPRVLDKFAPAFAQKALNRATYIGFALFCAAFCYFSIILVSDSRALGEVDTVMQWPLWPFQIILVVAFAIGTVRNSLYAIFIELAPLHRGEEVIDEETLKEYFEENKA